MAIQRFSARPSGIERYYRVKELAELTGISRESIYAAIEAGELPAYTPNGSTRRVIFEDDLVAWVKGK